MLSRLKALGALHAEFEKRLQSVETRLGDKLGELKRTLDSRWRTLERVEGSVKNLADAKSSWRRKVQLLQGELDAAKAQNSDLNGQVTTAMRRPGETGKDTEIRSLTARTTNAERRCVPEWDCACACTNVF
jgi:chromosome segregation ATPase